MPASLRFLIACLFLPLSAFGYSAEGHEIIADVAQELIKDTPASSHVKELLGSYTMSEVSTWADKIKGGSSPDADLNAWRDVNRDTPPGKSSARHSLHHYTNIPIQEDAYSPDSIGTDPDDIVHAMSDCIRILRGEEPSASFRGTSPKVALILLIHYAGDLAQPLHVGAGFLDSDLKWVNPNRDGTAQGSAGGNRLRWGSANIHYYWDRSVVDGAMRAAGFKGHPVEFSDQLVKEIQNEKLSTPTGKVETWPAQFATAMIPDSRKAYTGLKVVSVDGNGWTIDPPTEAYNTMAVAMTQRNLKNGGVHLAQVLEAIWPR